MYGMQFTGLVKTATTKFPMDHFRDYEYKEQDHHVPTATINGHPYMACGWSAFHIYPQHNTRRQSSWKTAFDVRLTLMTEVCIRYTKRPKVVEDYFEPAKVVDVHNHARQAGL